MLKKILLLLASICFSSYSFSNDTACKAVLCLSGGLANEKGFKECSAPITSYSNIRIYTYGKFNETLTSIARDRFIRQCEDASESYINRITMTYGHIEFVKL